jgi:hypothetical protein
MAMPFPNAAIDASRPHPSPRHHPKDNNHPSKKQKSGLTLSRQPAFTFIDCCPASAGNLPSLPY